jgi:glycosyltransferase involved in cell wall biosynthesis
MSEYAADLEVALLTGCKDRPYAYGLATGLASTGVSVDFVGSDDLDSPGLRATPRLQFLSLQRRKQQGRLSKAWRQLDYYARLIRYAVTSRARVFHILWNNRFEHFDRTLLMLLYKTQGKKVVLTAHNINQRKRDSTDSVFNRFTLKSQYRLVDHIFVHTQKMKQELIEDFAISEQTVTVLRHPINDAFPDTELTPPEAKRRLGIKDDERTLLFLGRITPYKGLEYLLEAFNRLDRGGVDYRLIIAGQMKKGTETYSQDIERLIRTSARRDQIIVDNQFIPDEKMELYLKAADVMVLPYTDIFQSGVLFLSFTFGLPVVAADVGSFREDVSEDRTGFLFRPRDVNDLLRAIDAYFTSDLFRNLSRHRQDIRTYFRQHHSWDAVALATRNVYAQLMRH